MLGRYVRCFLAMMAPADEAWRQRNAGGPPRMGPENSIHAARAAVSALLVSGVTSVGRCSSARMAEWRVELEFGAMDRPMLIVFREILRWRSSMTRPCRWAVRA